MNRKQIKEAQEKMLSNFFTIKDDVATFDVNYKKIDDILDPNFKGQKKPIIYGNFFEDMKRYTSLLPKKYKIEMNINIEDLQGYSLKDVEEIVFDNKNLFFIKRHQTKKNKAVSSIIMLILGTIFFSLYSIGIKFEWEQILNEFVYIACWVFYWEAVSIVFLEIFGEDAKLKQFINRINKINITNNKVND